MRVLWITNNVMPYPAKMLNVEASNFGGWILSMIDKVSKNKNINLAIATIYDCKNIIKYEKDGIKYYLVPGKKGYNYYSKTEKYWKLLDEDFNADIVHLFGSEFYHGLAYLNSHPNTKSILNIQGLVSICGREYLGGMTNKDILTNITIRDIIKRDNIYQQQKKYIKRGKYEHDIIKKVDYAIGRTFWDYYNVKSINPNIKYLKNNESLRELFYNNSWDIKKINRHSIFVSQASQPLKGFHMLLKALPIVKIKYPDVMVYVGGYDVTNKVSIKNKLKLSGYGKYLNNLIMKNNLTENIIFLGELGQEDVINYMLKSNVFILPSKIENSSNSLCEAMLLGVPSIVSFTGGTPDMLENNKEGLVYSYDDYEILANYIINIFRDDNLCKTFSSNSKKRAKERHDLDKNIKELINIYLDIYRKEE